MQTDIQRADAGGFVDQANAWARGVVSGDVIACKWVRLACRRHFDDLDHGAARGLYFDADNAERMARFYDVTPHVKGPQTSVIAVRRNNKKRRAQGLRLLPYVPIELADWQAFAVVSLFGWRRFTDEAAEMFYAVESDPKTWPLRFTIAHLCVARKNGKTTIISPMALYFLCAAGDGGAEVYSAATTRDQAKLMYMMAVNMVRRGPLKRALRITSSEIQHVESGSIFKPLSADHDTLDGFNLSFAGVDELHAHKNRGLYEVLQSSMGARASQLLLSITTAGVDRESICYETETMVKQVLDGTIESDSVFGLIFTVDDDDLADEKKLLTEGPHWYKANPNIGVSVSIDRLRQEAKLAMESPRKRSNFLRKRLNVWVGADSAWLDMAAFARCPPAAPLEQMRGLTSYLGLDLATKKDLAVLNSLVQIDGVWHPYVWAWFPSGQLKHLSAHQLDMYKNWERRGFLTFTDGDTCDQNVIMEKIQECGEFFDVATLAFDPWHAAKLIQDLVADGWPDSRVVEVGQTPKHLSEPMKTLEAWILGKKLANPQNSLLTYCLANIVAHEDKASNMKPNKETKANKIDAGVALIMSVSRALFTKPPKPSIYETRGFRSL